MKGETRFRKKVLKDLKTLKRTVIFPIAQSAIRGDPDYILCCAGLFVALELKDEDGDLSKLQHFKLLQVERANGFAFEARPSNWKEVFKHLNRIAKGDL